jgi:hypothetical protein
MSKAGCISNDIKYSIKYIYSCYYAFYGLAIYIVHSCYHCARKTKLIDNIKFHTPSKHPQFVRNVTKATHNYKNDGSSSYYIHQNRKSYRQRCIYYKLHQKPVYITGCNKNCQLHKCPVSIKSIAFKQQTHQYKRTGIKFLVSQQQNAKMHHPYYSTHSSAHINLCNNSSHYIAHQHASQLQSRGHQHHDLVAYATTQQGPATVLWDTDSFPIRVDNCCTRTLSFDIKDFIPDSLENVTNKAVSGFVANSKTPITKIGTISWKILDDRGVIRTIKIPNSYFVPEGTTRLLSPQHWAQQSNENINCITTATSVSLHWNHGNYSKTIQLNPDGNNVGTMWSEPGYSIAYQLADHTENHYPHTSFDTDPIEIQTPVTQQNDVDEDGVPWDHNDTNPTDLPNKAMTDTMLVPWLSQGGGLNEGSEENHELIRTAQQIQREIQRETTDTEKNVLSTEANNQLELMNWHVRLGHIQMSKIQRMAAAGMLPKRIASCKQPLCQSCMYGMMVKRAWRSKQIPKSIAPNTSRPGQHVSVDQMESPVPGLIGQLKGKPTVARYRFATVFVDSFSRASYIHLQQTSNS